ncbi:MAG: glycosyltransferase family 9 protein [Fibrobacterota bacterium]
MALPSVKSASEASEDIIFDAVVMNPVSKKVISKTGLFNKVYFIDFMNIGLIKSLKETLQVRRNKYNLSFLIFPANYYKYQVVHFLFGARKRFSHTYQKKAFPDLFFLSNKRIAENRSLHSVEENFALFEFGLGKKLARRKMFFPVFPNDEEKALSFLETAGIGKAPFVGFHPGCDTLKNHVNRRWHPEKFATLAKKIYHEFGMKTLLFGGPAEEELKRSIARLSGGSALCVEGLSFTESAALIKKSSVFVSNDSGLMHTAASLNVPVVALIGPTNPVYISPYCTLSSVVKKDFPCMPCFEYSRKPLYCSQDQQFKCIRNIDVDDAFFAVSALLSKENE